MQLLTDRWMQFLLPQPSTHSCKSYTPQSKLSHFQFLGSSAVSSWISKIKGKVRVVLSAHRGMHASRQSSIGQDLSCLYWLILIRMDCGVCRERSQGEKTRRGSKPNNYETLWCQIKSSVHAVDFWLFCECWLVFIFGFKKDMFNFW